ncbi:winged helix DNA-binding domain-containing protein [Streptomyces sp. XM4193]|uniref:winged helix DNA-binding domain-containing protein n=1 Tax=Streptomyces sp. XM4193 TaxID=2929782 RepID=UPI001FF81D13|nr:winged helix DNA-binding domain-containing protein [Streptomyces sp. XM4193]MCK1795946.1 winged helix DNA-binding domain-containing protein [Streptomyces sp. XM4193]
MGETPQGPESTWRAVNARRLRRHRLLEAEAGAGSSDVAAVAGAICGAHVQVLSAAELSLALRLGGAGGGPAPDASTSDASTGGTADRRDVRRALWEDRELVKTYGARGTVHLLPTAELPLWCGALAALGEEVGTGAGPRLLTGGQIDALAAALEVILADDELTTDELTEALVEAVGPWAGDPVMEAFQGHWPRWRWATALLAHRGALCFAPDKGRRVAYTSPQRWSPGFEPLEGAAAVRELARHYLWSYGPATPAEFARWLAAPKPWAEAVFDALGEEIEPVRLNGVPCRQLAGDELADEHPVGVRLLPYFDAFAVGSHPRDLLFPGAAATRALSRGRAGNYPVLLVEGEVAGVWHHRRSGRRLQLAVEPLRRLPGTVRSAVEEQAERVAVALEATALDFRIGEITVGPHA